MGNIIVGDLVRHEILGIGRVKKSSGGECIVFFPRNEKEKNMSEDDLQILSEQEMAAYDMLKLAVHEVRMEEIPTVPMGARWKGGELVLKPADTTQASKSIPIETFFHKIVMIRDRLRVLEAQINGQKTLMDSEKVDLQQYITRIYGSLTTFNILFKEKQDYFVGQRSGEGGD